LMAWAYMSTRMYLTSASDAFRLGGPGGAAWGAVALILPGALMLLGLSALYFRGEFSPTMAHGLRGVAAAIVGLVFVTTGRIIPVALRTWRAAVIAAAVRPAAQGDVPVDEGRVDVAAVVGTHSLWEGGKVARPRRAFS